MTSLPAAALLEQSVDWSGSPGATHPPFEIGKGRLKEIQALGHKVNAYLSARGRWWRHAAKAGFDSHPSWARGFSPSAPGVLGEEGFFACALLVEEARFRLQGLTLPEVLAHRLAGLWQRVDPGAPSSLPQACAVPADANAPIWLALLRLRPLREFWDRELRRATVDSLLGYLEDAWVLDPGRVPEGAVIPRLEIASWNELPNRRERGRAFSIAKAETGEGVGVLDDEASAEEWSVITERALEAFAEEPRVLLESGARGSAAATMVISFYEKKAGRVEGLGSMALVPDGAGRLAATRVAVA